MVAAASPFAPGTQTQTHRQPLQIALDFAAQGFSVIPVKRAHEKADRKPLIKWGAYQTQRPTLDELRAWWQTWPTANPVIVTGALSGIITLDVDGPDGLAWLKAQGELPPTLTITRGAPGRYHLWFKHPGFKVGNRNLHPQVEVKGDGGLIPCPGALHWSGAPYRVVKAFAVAACPTWLIDLVKPQPRPAPQPYQPGPDDDLLIGLAVDALAQSRSENREDWLAVLMALHSAGEQYRALAHTFSARCPEKYNPRVVDQTWNSFRGSGIALGTLFWMADQDTPGWRPAREPLAFSPHTEGSEPSPMGDTLPAAWPSEIGDGLRAVALNAKLEAVLKVYELIAAARRADLLAAGEAVTKPGLKAFNAQLGLELSPATIERGLDQGVAVISSKMQVENLQNRSEDDSTCDFDELSTRRAKSVYAYHPLPPAAVKRNLLNRLQARLIEKHFPLALADDLMPVLDGALLFDEATDLTADEQAEVLRLVRASGQDQDELERRRRLKRLRREYAALRARLDDPHSTSLPAGWGRQYAVCFYRAVHEAEPKDRRHIEIALLTGRRAERIKDSVITRAGLEDRAKPAERLPLVYSETVKIDACQAARGQGKIHAFVATLPDGAESTCPLDAPDLQGWAQEQVQKSASLAVELYPKHTQTVIGPIVAPKPRQAKLVAPSAAAEPPKPAQKTSAPVRPSKPVYTGPGLAPTWRRDYFLTAYARLNKTARPEADLLGLTVSDAARLLIGRFCLSDERLIDRETGEILRTGFVESAAKSELSDTATCAREILESAPPADLAPAVWATPGDENAVPVGNLIPDGVSQECTESVPESDVDSTLDDDMSAQASAADDWSPAPHPVDPAWAEERRAHEGLGHPGPASRNPAIYCPLPDRLAAAAGHESHG